MANKELPLTNKDVIEIANTKKKVRVIVERPTSVGGIAYDEPMTFTGQPNKNGMTVSISLKGVKSWSIQPNDKRFEENDRGYTIRAYPL